MTTTMMRKHVLLGTVTLCLSQLTFHRDDGCDVDRCLDSEWFVWVSQSNHIPMDIEEDKERPWLALQVRNTVRCYKEIRVHCDSVCEWNEVK